MAGNYQLSTDSKKEYIPLKTRKKDTEWYASIRDYYMPAYSREESDFYQRYKKLYEFFNNDLSSYMDELQRMCNSLIDLGAAEELILSYNKLRNKFEVLAGDLLKRKNSHNIYLLSSTSIRQKDEEYKQQILEAVDRELQRTIEEFGPELSQITPEKINQFIQEFKAQNIPRDFDRKSFKSQLEQYKYNMLRLEKRRLNIVQKMLDSFKHLFISDRLFLANRWVNGKPTIEVVNTLFCDFDKSPDLKDVKNLHSTRSKKWQGVNPRANNKKDLYFPSNTDYMLNNSKKNNNKNFQTGGYTYSGKGQKTQKSYTTIRLSF